MSEAGSSVAAVQADTGARRVRDARIDALRGLAIALVVLGHSLVRATPAQPNPGPGLVLVPGVGYIATSTASAVLLNVVYSFHIPLFAFVSGIVLFGSSRGYGIEFARRRFLALMVPYFAWVFIGWLTVGGHTTAGLAQFMVASATDPQAPGALWFLYALFASSLTLALVRSASTSEWVLGASALLVGLAGIVPLGAYDHFLGVAEVAWVYPFLAVGFIFAAHRDYFDRRMSFWFPAALVVWALAIPLVSPQLIGGPRWWFEPVATAFARAGLPGAYVVSKSAWAFVRVVGALGGVLSAYYAYAFVRGRARDAQAWVGKRSIGIYALQAAFLLPFGEPWGWRHVALLFILAMTGSILVTLVVERFKWTRVVLLGRPA